MKNKKVYQPLTGLLKAVMPLQTTVQHPESGNQYRPFLLPLPPLWPNPEQ